MKIKLLQPFLKTHSGIFVITMLVSTALIFTVFSTTAYPQGSQLTLADVLVALRSKKVTLPERNKILTDAVQKRGTTFTVTPEIEKELSGTGADKSLIDSIRQKGQIAKISAVVPTQAGAEVKPKVEPEAPPASPDFSFYEKRADASSSKGDLDAALIDYTKAIEMNGSSVGALLGRGAVYYGKNSYTLAIADYSKVIELNPQDSVARARRGEAYEKMGNLDLAATDYKKALEIDPANESAKSGTARLQAEQAKTIQKPDPVVAPPSTITTPVIPEYVDLGQLADAQAIRMIKPIYSQNAINSGIGGEVVVNIELDAEGNVTSAKVVSGHPFLRQASLDAARKCKFKPGKFGDQAVKAKGYIVYNFVRRR